MAIRVEEAIKTGGSKNIWIIFEINQKTFALPSTYIREMLVLGKVNKLVQSPSYVRGLTTRRGSTVLAVDLRKWLAMGSRLDESEELIDVLHAREQDHVNWLNELKATVLEDRPFKLTTDPHACAFGKWYDSFSTAHISLRMQLDKFDKPHKSIHAIAIKVGHLLEEHKRDEALATINATWEGELALMRTLFEKTRQLLRQESNETIIITEKDNRLVGFIVDSVEGVREIEPDVIEEFDDTSNSMGLNCKSEGIFGVAKLEDKTCILLDTSAVC